MLTHFRLFQFSSVTLFGVLRLKKMPCTLLYSVINFLKGEYSTRIEENTDLISNVKGSARVPVLISNDKP